MKSVDEKQKSSFWYGFASNYVFNNDELLPISPEDSLFLKQCQIIENLYKNESCIIVGRCADFILKDKPNVVKVFIYSSDLQFKLDRKAKLENCEEKEIREKLERIDRERANYYNHFTSLVWGEKANYDICLDTSKIGVEQTIDILEDYVKGYLKQNEIKLKKSVK